LRISGVIWAGTRTDRYEEMVAFARDVLGMKIEEEDEGLTLFRLPDGDALEVFDPDADGGGHPQSDRVVAGLLVEDLDAARDELQDAGAEVRPGGSDPTASWFYFRAPDGNLYEMIERT
jgi:catechol 2,3-dioxygenase-like lactoylglutathione lyase family enzyme